MRRVLEQAVKRGVEMIKRYYACDWCGKTLDYEIVQTPFGDEREIIKGLGTTKVWNTKRLFPHLCKECALAIDYALIKEKFEILMEARK